MSVVPERIDFADYGKSLLPGIFRGKTNWEAWIDVIAAPMQRLENALFDLLLLRAISTAVGKQLDIIGQILNEKRLGTDDERYRIRLRAKILILKSSGTLPQLLAILELLMAGDYEVRPAYPRAWVIEAHQATTDAQAEELARALSKARARGINGQFIWSDVDDDESFLFADGTTLEESTTQGFAWPDSLTLLRTTDIADSPSGGTGTGFAARNSAGIWVLTQDDGNVLVSTDDGETYTTYATGTGSGNCRVDCLLDRFFITFLDELWVSDDGQTWTQVLIAAAAINDLATDGGTNVVVVSNGANKVYFSSDSGDSFSPGTGGFGGSTIFRVQWFDAGGVFVASGGSGKIASSPDGDTWTQQSSGISGNVSGLAAGSSVIVAGTTSGGNLSTSTDGLTWSASAAPIVSFIVIVFDGYRFWGTDGSSDEIYTSVDGVNWDATTVPPSDVQALVVAPDLTVLALADSGTEFYFSGDAGLSWTTIDLSPGYFFGFGVADDELLLVHADASDDASASIYEIHAGGGSLAAVVQT